MTHSPRSDSPGDAPTKDNAHIEADRAAFMDAYGRARKQFAKLNGVAGVGFGLKITGSKITDDVAIIVHVRAKKSSDKLSADERIPASFEGYRTDVRASAPIKFASTSCDNDQAYPKIQGGIQIEPWSSSAPLNKLPFRGTLGCLVRKRQNSNDDNWYALTCQHVLFDDTNLKTKDGDGLYHPYKPRTDRLGVVRTGTLLGPMNSADTKKGIVDGTYMDCGVVRLDIGSRCFGSTCGTDRLTPATTIVNLNVVGQPWITPQNKNQITDVRSVETDSSILNTQVFKVGRTTARTVGRVISNNFPADDVVTIVTEDGTEVVPVESRPNCIEIVLDQLALNCQGKDCFGWDGDSGAVVVDDHNAVIGIFFARNEKPDPATNHYFGYACHIVPVLDQLQVCVPAVGGTKHGTTNATDGSGLTAAKKQADLDSLDSENTGGLTFVAAALRSRIETSPSAAEPMPLSSAQQSRLTSLHESLRETPRGRELDDALTEARREIAYLVRRCRPVTVVWHRNRGPAFLARTLNHLRGDEDVLPLDMGGVSRTELFERMRIVLAAHGSNPLRATLDQHADLLPLLAEATTAEQLIAAVGQTPSADPLELSI